MVRVLVEVASPFVQRRVVRFVFVGQPLVFRFDGIRVEDLLANPFVKREVGSMDDVHAVEQEDEDFELGYTIVEIGVVTGIIVKSMVEEPLLDRGYETCVEPHG